VAQYNGGLKTVALQDGRYDKKQVVLLVSLTCLYQEICFEENQKYDRWESVLGSLVFHRSKDDETGHEPLSE